MRRHHWLPVSSNVIWVWVGIGCTLATTLSEYEWILVFERDDMWGLTLAGKGNEVFLIRVWKPLSNICVLKLWDWQWYVMGQSRQYLLVVELDYYNWYKS